MNMGNHLADVIQELGLRPMHDCGCTSLQQSLNTMPLHIVERNKSHICSMIKQKREKLNWTQTLTATINAISSGLAFKLDLCDLEGSLLNEAIRRARKEVESTKAQ